MYKVLRKNRAKCTTWGGFTLAELLIVVAVIAVLVAVAVPTFSGQLEKSRQSVDLSTLREAYAIAKLAQNYQDDSSKTDIYSSTETTSLYNLKHNNALDDGQVAYYWYSVEHEWLQGAKPENETKSLGKATISQLRVDTSQLPPNVTYTENVALLKKANTDDRDGTVAKYPLVKFVYTKEKGFTLEDVTFAFIPEGVSAASPSLVYYALPGDGSTGLDIKTLATITGATNYTYAMTPTEATLNADLGGSWNFNTSTSLLTWNGDTFDQHKSKAVTIRATNADNPTQYADVNLTLYTTKALTIKKSDATTAVSVSEPLAITMSAKRAFGTNGYTLGKEGNGDTSGDLKWYDDSDELASPTCEYDIDADSKLAGISITAGNKLATSQDITDSKNVIVTVTATTATAYYKGAYKITITPAP